MDYLLDTNIVSYIMNENTSLIRDRLQQELLKGKNIYMSGIVYYEVQRGLLTVEHVGKARRFERICLSFRVLGLDDIAVFDRAANIYVETRRSGHVLSQEDILIAATALHHNLCLVTNDGDFSYVSGLTTENWLS